MNSIWETLGDITLYAKWVRDLNATDDDVTLWVNGTPIINSIDVSGDGWSYSSDDGIIRLSTPNKTYDIYGTDLDGMAAIVAQCSCTIQVSSNLTMNASHQFGRTPITLTQNSVVTIDVKENAMCDLTASAECTAIRVPSTSTLTRYEPASVARGPPRRVVFDSHELDERRQRHALEPDKESIVKWCGS